MASNCPFVQLWNSVFGIPEVSWTPPGLCVASCVQYRTLQCCADLQMAWTVPISRGCCALRNGSQCSVRSPGQGLNESSLLPALYCLTAERQVLAERSGLFTKTSGLEVSSGRPGVACSLVECLSSVWEAWVLSPALKNPSCGQLQQPEWCLLRAAVLCTWQRKLPWVSWVSESSKRTSLYKLAFSSGLLAVASAFWNTVALSSKQVCLVTVQLSSFSWWI